MAHPSKRNNKPRFDLRRREFDGKIVRWEQKRLSELGILPEAALGLDGKSYAPYDHQVWVVTGVFNNRREVFS